MDDELERKRRAIAEGCREITQKKTRLLREAVERRRERETATHEVSVTQALKPCPFCGSAALTCLHSIEATWSVSCARCDVVYPYVGVTEREAIAAWNTRAITPAERTLLTLVDAMREYLPSDGISKDEFIQRILEALDNDEMAKLIGELEGRK